MNENALALTHAPLPARAGLAALLALDEQLGAILRSTRAPMVGQLRLAWWRDALAALDGAAVPAQPVLRALATHVLPSGTTGRMLAGMADGWEALLGEPLDEAALETHAATRGRVLFEAGARVLGEGAGPAGPAGEGWALSDLSRNLSDPGLAARARAMAGERLDAAFARRWPPLVRPLGALAWLARMDLAPGPRPAGHPARAWRLLRFRLTGR